MGRVLRRHKQKLLSSDDDDSPLPPCRTDLTFAVLDRFSHLVLYDSGPGLDRLLICGCNELLDSLARSTFWLADGTCTFKVVPSIYFQLYTIHFQFVTGANPVGVYCLLPNKTREIYDRMLMAIKELVPLANPTYVLVDFESASIGAFRNAFPNARVYGCYFHRSQSIGYFAKLTELA